MRTISFISFILFSALALMLFPSCGGEADYPAELVMADSAYMVGNHPRGDYLLAAYEQQPRNQDEDIDAYYQLLKLEQAYMREALTDEHYSVADSLCRYYNNGSRAKYAKALLFLATVHRETNNSPEAIKCLLESYEKAQEADDERLLCIISREIGDFYFWDQWNFDKAIPYYHSYYDQSIALGDTLRMAYGALCMADVYRIVEDDVDSAVYYSKQAIELSRKFDVGEDIALVALEKMCNAYVSAGQFAEVERIMPHEEIFDADWANWHYGQGNIDSAIYYFERTLVPFAWQQGTLELLAGLEKERGNLAAAVEYYERASAAAGSIREQQQAEATLQAEARYKSEVIKEQRDRLDKRNREMRHLVTLLLVVLAGVAVAGVLLWQTYWQRRRAIAAQLQLLENVKRQQQQPEGQEGAGGRMEELRQSDVYRTLRSLAAKGEGRMTPDDWAALTVLTDAAFNGLSGRLRSLATLSDMELRICQLRKLDFAPQEIADVLSRSKQAISMARRRMYHKFTGRSGSADDFDALLAEL